MSVYLWKKKLCGLHLKLKVKRMPQLPFKFSNKSTAIVEMLLQKLCTPACFWWRARIFFAVLFNLLVCSWFCINLSSPNSATLKYLHPPIPSSLFLLPALFCFFLSTARGKKFCHVCVLSCLAPFLPEFAGMLLHLRCSAASARALPFGAPLWEWWLPSSWVPVLPQMETSDAFCPCF